MMNQIPDDELLSAYLDGEVDKAQRAHVEGLLAEQPDFRQRYDDLRILRGGFEALPKLRLPDDFAARVLRCAERAVLSGDDPPARVPAPEAVPAPETIEPASRHAATWGLSWQRAKRPLIWASLALAAGLLIMIYDRGPAPHAGRDVAEKASGVRQERHQAEKASGVRRQASEEAERVGVPPGGAAPAPPNPQSVQDRFLVVVCEVSEQPGYREEFRRALAEQQIAWTDGGATTPVDKEATLGRAGGATLSDKSKDVDAKQAAPAAAAPAESVKRLGRQALEERFRALAEPQELQKALARAASRVPFDAVAEEVEGLSPLADAEVVLVEAAPQQLEAVLHELDDHPDAFATVEVRPAPDVPEQQPLNYYSRRARQPGRRKLSSALKGGSEMKRDISPRDAADRQDLGAGQPKPAEQLKRAEQPQAAKSDEPPQANGPAKESGQRQADGRRTGGGQSGDRGWAVTLQTPASSAAEKGEKAEVGSLALSAGAARKPESSSPSEPAPPVPPAGRPARGNSFAADGEEAGDESAAPYRVLFVFRRASPPAASASPVDSPDDSP